MRRLRDIPELASGLEPHDGLLALGVARELVHADQVAVKGSYGVARRTSERQRLLSRFTEVLSWRKAAQADAILESGLPANLMSGAQSESWEYGRTLAGLPVFIDKASTWLSAIRAARKQNLAPKDYAVQRIFWHEKCLQRARATAASGM